MKVNMKELKKSYAHLAEEQAVNLASTSLINAWVFFNMIKERLIQLQKAPVRVRARDNPHAWHIYCIKVDAWTYGKETCGQA